MIDLIIYAVSLIVAFWAGVHYAQVRFMFRIGKEPEKFIKMLEQIRELNADEEVKISLGAPDDAIMLNNRILGSVDSVRPHFSLKAPKRMPSLDSNRFSLILCYSLCIAPSFLQK